MDSLGLGMIWMDKGLRELLDKLSNLRINRYEGMQSLMYSDNEADREALNRVIADSMNLLELMYMTMNLDEGEDGEFKPHIPG